MKKIISSLAMIALVGAIVVGGTGAFFSDTETSKGNILTAGSIDLKVDHKMSYYNDMVCVDGAWQDEEEVSWKTLWQIGDEEASQMDNPVDELNWPGQFGSFPAFPNPFQIGTNTDNEFPWNSNYAKNYATDFDVDFNYGGAEPVSAKLTIGWSPGKSDQENKVITLESNGTNIGTTPTRLGAPVAGWWEEMERFQDEFIFTIEPGLNTINFKHPQGDGTLWDFVRLETMSGVFDGECQLWEEKDIEEGDHFFAFNDIKPGDWGKDVISLHVYDNDSWLCMSVDNQVENDNGLTEPEEELDNTGGDGEGELGGQISVFAWRETDGDGEYEPADETGFYEGPLSGFTGEAMHDSTTQTHLVATTTEYVSLAWCAGTQTVNNQTGDIECSAEGMDNSVQSDSFSADLSFLAEQVRNNPDFTCEDMKRPERLNDPRQD